MRIAVIGAGSHFTLALLRALYQTARHDEYQLRLMDVHPEPLAQLDALLPQLNALTGHAFRWSLHQELVPALEGADHVLAAFAVDFPAAFLRTCWIMHNHGIQFVEGETATPGALMATLRHLPLLLEIARKLQRLAPRAWLHVINNPMPRLVQGIMRGTGYTRVVGHCHGTLAVRAQLARLFELRAEEIDLFVVGINHFHLVQRAVSTRDGRDVLHALKTLQPEKVAQWQASDFTQWRLFEDLGYFIGHGIWHNFDYLPYANTRMFRHSAYNTWERACLAVQARRQVGAAAELGSHLEDEQALRRFIEVPEPEQVFSIMQALSGESGPYRYLSGNMPNAGHVADLPEGAIIEVPAIVSATGIALDHADRPLPLFFSCWLRQQLAIHELSVRVVLEGNRQAAIEAIACDPTFRDCNCGPGQLLDEMLEANRGLVPALR
jgi:alpha-galactosidase